MYLDFNFRPGWQYSVFVWGYESYMGIELHWSLECSLPFVSYMHEYIAQLMINTNVRICSENHTKFYECEEDI